MTFKCVIVAVAALAVASPPTVAADDTSQSHGSPATDEERKSWVELAADGTSRFRGSGIYRPFNLMRQVKLSTAYFVNPSLPSRVDITYARRLSDVMEDLPVKKVADAVERGEMRLAMPVDESSGYLTPIQAPCQIRAGSPQTAAHYGCEDWLNALREERPDALRSVHVFVDKELSVTGTGRVVTWDPHEVVEGWCNLPLSSESVPLR